MAQESIRVSGQEVAYRRSSGEGRPVVFVHGNSSSSRTWHHLLDGAFGQRYRCLALDLPGHGASSPAADAETYSLPGYAAILSGFVDALDARDAVIVGWSLGGHIALEAVPALPDAAGYVIFGTPPVSGLVDLPNAFQPNPAVQIGFTADVDPEAARAYATSFFAPDSTLSTDELVADILRTDGTARSALAASMAATQFADELEVVAALDKPLAILHGEREQLVSLDYLGKLNAATLWRGAVQVIPAAGHAPQEETPDELAGLLDQFISELIQQP